MKKVVLVAFVAFCAVSLGFGYSIECEKSCSKNHSYICKDNSSFCHQEIQKAIKKCLDDCELKICENECIAKAKACLGKDCSTEKQMCLQACTQQNN